MVRTPIRTCPNLSRLLDDAEPDLLALFLEGKAFEKLAWLGKYRQASGDQDGPTDPGQMLRAETKERLSPLEAEAARVSNIAGDRGQYALEGLARTKLHPDRMAALQGTRDELARSLWAYVHESAVFEAAENSLHLRLYRRYDRHYQTFVAEPARGSSTEGETSVLELLLAELRVRLDRGEGYSIDRFDIPADGDEPAAEMYLIFHPEPPTSVREIDEAGNRSRIYFRPPGEAMIVHTPSTGRVHVRAGTRRLRHMFAESFIGTVLGQPPSRQPVDFQAYDISRFLSDFVLSLPDFEDPVILRAQVIRVDIAIGDLANRLSLSTTIDQDLTEIIGSEPGLGRVFERAVAIRFVEIAVRYRRFGAQDAQTLDFTITDRNSSSLLSLDDPLERVLGHRLLREWGILSEGRAPSETESISVLPALLQLWDIGAESVSGAWLLTRRIEPSLLVALGFLVPAGWQGEELIDDEDDVGAVPAEVVVRPEGVDLMPAPGQEAPGGPPEMHRKYRVRDGWVAQHLRERVVGILDVPAVEELNPHILALGTLRIDGRDVPVYLARGLSDERAHTAVDTELRARHDRGIGLVLQAGTAIGRCLAANVLVPILDHLDGNASELRLAADSLRAVFLRHQGLARGGQTVQFDRTGESAGTLFVPGRGSIDIVGEHRVLVIERLVDAHNRGPAPMATEDMIRGIEGQSLANIFKRPLWDKLKADFLRKPRRGLWEIAT